MRLVFHADIPLGLEARYGGPGQEQLRPATQVQAEGVAARLEDMELRGDFGFAQFDEEGDAVGQRRHHRVVGGQANEGRRRVGSDMAFSSEAKSDAFL
jgi:hypothetical protein